MPRRFDGVVNIDMRDSVQDWPAFREPSAPAGAPNILLVLYDDTGLAAWSPYGGRIDMPVMQRLAEGGLTYTQWHTTALCSPTRSCLLTGRNHHQNGFAQIAEGATGFPGHTGHIPMENASMAEVLRENGWNTFWIGKNHNVPIDEWTMGATKRNWPLARGFDRFYGFIGGETNQWYPDLVEDNHYDRAGHGHGGGRHPARRALHLLWYVYNFLGIPPEQQLVSPGTLAPGAYVLGVEFEKESLGDRHEALGTATLHINDSPVAEAPWKTQSGHFTLCGEGLSIGRDAGDAVSREYTPHFAFTGGRIVKVEVSVGDDAYIDLARELQAGLARD